MAAPRLGCIGMSTLTIKCACCGEPLTAPERTEYVDAHRVRHVWKCEPCNYSFSATIAAEAAAARVPTDLRVIFARLLYPERWGNRPAIFVDS